MPRTGSPGYLIRLCHHRNEGDVRLPKEADFQFALARSYLAAGRDEEARRSLQAALGLAQSDAIRARYRAGFAALAGEQPPAGSADDLPIPSLPTDRSL